ncbi:unnamed protein product [Adineta steineri]|uniref:F-box domain-containing protein n=1 Tax=Adineta steineri TaxID=433720 RepID=A0A814Z9L1_9BILA|nr:unnamed protein product [Adineta steineri]
MYRNHFARLPVEIICIIFDYLPAHEILLAFSGINPFFDTILSTYLGYQFDFKSILRSHYDLVCSRIPPNQVISLTLSDLDDTPGQTQLFFSRFRITDFNRVRFLTLVNIEPASWKHIYPYVRNMDSHHRLIIVSTNVDLLPYAEVLFHSSRLQINIASQLQTQQHLPRLRSLTVSQSSIAELMTICASATQLTSLKVHEIVFNTNDEMFLPAQQLKCLVLNLGDVPVSMDQMNHLLLNLPRLKHLELSATGSMDLIDAQQWETISRQLITFHFDFSVRIVWIEQILESFRTPFWIQEKQWFVACTWQRLFSVPYFADTCANTSFRPPLYTTAPEETLFFDYIDHFIVNNSSIIHHHYFRCVKTLELQVSNAIEKLSAFIDLSQVETLIVACVIDESTISFLLKSIPHLRQLSINTGLRNFLVQTKNMRLEHIRTLEIKEPLGNGDYYILEQLGRLFPKVEVLRVKSIWWKTGIARLIDNFSNLLNASFRLELLTAANQPNRQLETEIAMKKSMIDESRRLKDEMFTCQQRSDPTAGQNRAIFLDFWFTKNQRVATTTRILLLLVVSLARL